MQFSTLLDTDLRVSRACLGTMSFGAHVDEPTAFAVMDRALDLGVNFFDTAEMYSVPTSAETYGLTEEIIGRWMKSRGTRGKIVLASKVAGSSRGGHAYIREGKIGLDRGNIRLAIEGSLRRLGVETIDLYQTHWPHRSVNKFWQRAYVPGDDSQAVPILETMRALEELRQEGKIRAYGVSNETPWGMMEHLRLAREYGLPKPASVQNNYSLLTRSYEVAMSEITHREGVGLLGYSPMGYGILSGRYADGAFPAGGRFTKYREYLPRYRTPEVQALVERYRTVADAAGITLPTLALSFAYSRWFMASVILGPSNPDQLEEGARALDVALSDETLAAIDRIHESCPNPCA